MVTQTVGPIAAIEGETNTYAKAFSIVDGTLGGTSATLAAAGASGVLYYPEFEDLPAGEWEIVLYTSDDVAMTVGWAQVLLATGTYELTDEPSGSLRATSIAAILADTNELQTDWANGGRLDLLLDSAAAGGGGGGGTVQVLPAVGIVADRTAGVTLKPIAGETISQAITVYQSDGTTAYDLSGKTLAIIFETMAGVDVAVVASGDITVSGDDSNVVTFAYPAAVTASERTLKVAIRDAAAPLTVYLQGVCSVVNAPSVDS